MDFDISAAQSDLIKEIFRRGNPADEWYRYISYATVADLFTSFRSARRDLRPEEVDAIRARLIASLEEAENSFSRKQDSEKTPLYLRNSLGVPTAALSQAGPIGDGTADDNDRQPSRQWLPNLISFAVGASLVLLFAWFLQQFGAIYIVTSSQPIEQFAQFDQSLGQTRNAVEDAMEALRLTEAQVRGSMTNGTAALPPGALKNFIPISTAFPDFYKTIETKIPKFASLIVRLSPDGRGYKVLMQSELCGAVAFQDPSKVDPVRNVYGYLCRNFGLWNKAGRDL